jgi:hypothetical protein
MEFNGDVGIRVLFAIHRTLDVEAPYSVAKVGI